MACANMETHRAPAQLSESLGLPTIAVRSISAGSDIANPNLAALSLTCQHAPRKTVAPCTSIGPSRFGRNPSLPSR